MRGYPTIKYFTAEVDAKGADYQGGRDFDSLKKHVVDKLEVKCDVGSPDACDDKEKKYIAKKKGGDKDALAKEIKRLNGMKGKKMSKKSAGWVDNRLHLLGRMKDEL